QGGAQVHDGLGVGGEAGVGGKLLRQLPQLAVDGSGAGPAGDGAVPGQHPLDVAVENRRPQAKGDADDGPGCGAANSRELAELVNGGWKAASEVGYHLAGGPVQVAGPGVVAEAGPQVEHVIQRRRRQGLDIRIAVGEALKVGKTRLTLSCFSMV